MAITFPAEAFAVTCRLHGKHIYCWSYN